MPGELKLDLNFGSAEARIDAIIQRLERATQAAIAFQAAINNAGGGGPSPANGNGAAYNPGTNGNGAASNAAGLHGSSTIGATGGTTPAQQQAQASVQGTQTNVAAYQQFTKQYPGLNPAAYQTVAQQLGVTAGTAQVGGAVPSPAASPTTPPPAFVGVTPAQAVAGANQAAHAYTAFIGGLGAANGNVVAQYLAGAPSPAAMAAAGASPGQITALQMRAAILGGASRNVFPLMGANSDALAKMFPSRFMGFPGVPMFAAAELSNIGGAYAGEYLSVQRAQNQILQQQYGGQFVFGGQSALLTQAAGIQGRYNTVRNLTGQDLPLVGGLMQYLFRGVDAGFERDIAGAQGQAQAAPLLAQLSGYGIPLPLDRDAAYNSTLRQRAGVAGAMFPFGVTAARAGDNQNFAALAKAFGENAPVEAAQALARYAGNPLYAPIRGALMGGAGIPEAARMALPAMAAAGDLDALAALRSVVPGADLDAYQQAAGGILNAQGVVTITGFGVQAGAAGLRTAVLRGARAGQQSGILAYRGQRRTIRGEMEAIDAQMDAIAALPGGTDLPQYAELRAKKAQASLSYQEVGNEFTGLRLSQSTGEYAVTMGGLAVKSTRAGLYDPTGRDVAAVGRQQGLQIGGRIRELQRLRDQAKEDGRLDYQTELSINSEIQSLRQQQVTIPASVSSRQMELLHLSLGVGTASAESGVMAAGLYGSNSDLAKAFDTLGKQVATRISTITDQLKDKNLPIDQRRAAETEVASLRGQQEAVRAQAATAQVGRSALVYGSTLAGTQTSLMRAALFGTDSGVGGAYAGMASTLVARGSQLDRQIADPNVPFDVKQRLMQEREGVRQQQMANQVNANQTAIGRVESRAATAQGQTSNVLHAAAVVGGAADVGQAASGHVAALHNEAAQLNAKLTAGGLSFDQEQAVRQRLNSIQRESFDTVQGAIDTGIRKTDLSGYDLASMRQSNVIRRLQSMPYAPGNITAAQMQGIGLRNQRVGQLRAREAALSAAGQLSPERRYDIESEIEGSVTQNYEAFADMTTGAENRLGALSSRMPAGFHTFNGSARAAVFYKASGVPFLSSGFAGGAHERAVESLFGNALPYPRSPMANLNPAGAFGGGDVAGLLTQILQELRQQNGRGKGSFPRMNRGPGDLPPSGGYQRTGANTPFN